MISVKEFNFANYKQLKLSKSKYLMKTRPVKMTFWKIEVFFYILVKINLQLCKNCSDRSKTIPTVPKISTRNGLER